MWKDNVAIFSLTRHLHAHGQIRMHNTLDPLLWNTICDDILGLMLPKKVKFMAFTDDI